MYSYNAYIHSRIHIFFYVSSLIIRSISVCCVRVVMRMCLLQHDTTLKAGSYTPNMRVRLHLRCARVLVIEEFVEELIRCHLRR